MYLCRANSGDYKNNEKDYISNAEICSLDRLYSVLFKGVHF